MMKLAKKTSTVETRMGSHKTVSGFILTVLPVPRSQCQNIRARMLLKIEKKSRSGAKSENMVSFDLKRRGARGRNFQTKLFAKLHHLFV